MILRFTSTKADYLAFNTENVTFTTVGRIVAEYDEARKFLPHVIELYDSTDIWNIIEELKSQGFKETDESYIFYNSSTKCTEYNTDDLPFC